MNKPVCENKECAYYQSFFKPNELIQSYIDYFMEKNKPAKAYQVVCSVKGMCLACVHFEKQDIPNLLVAAEALYNLKQDNEE
ncbi:MAG: hypothetical protein U9Q83_07525 [Bacteroidota bacterium]|nr:hypothetical protein [Bacteroidota bacterium]